MFSNPLPTSNTRDEGTVVQVDVHRSLCKVRTLTGQILHSVSWLIPSGGSTRSGDRTCPTVGDRVMIDSGLGYPIIVGYLPRLQVPDGATPIKINSGEKLTDTGSYSPEGTSTWADQNKPEDILLGDRIISTIGGGFFALLRTGSTIIRASRLSEIFLDRFTQMIRVVSRNWEHFTDVSSDVVRNFKGKVYRYIGYAPTFLQSKNEDYRLHFYYGDTNTAETVKTNYNTYSGSPSTNSIIYKEQVTDLPASTPRELMRRTLNLSGNQEVYIWNGTHFTRVTSTAEQLQFTWNDQNIVTIKEAEIHAVHKDGADVILDANGIRATFHDGNINMSDSSIVTTFDGGTVTMNSTEITTVRGSGSVKVTDSEITAQLGAGQAQVTNSSTKIVNGPHAVTVSSTGVAIT